MMNWHRRTRCVATALLLGTTAAGTAQGGMSPQGMSPQGMSPQGMSPQGMSPQGISMDAAAAGSVLLINDQAVSGLEVYGSALQGYRWQSGQWVPVTGSGFVGATLESDMVFRDGGVTASQHVKLYIADVKTDTTTNTMVCDPQNPYLTSCSRSYHLNSDVKLYKMAYWVDEPGVSPVLGWLCGGDGMAMVFKGEWGEDGEWINNSTKITVSCTDGVLAKCARSWGYKPWKTAMIDKHGNPQNMRGYHQACTRAAQADYSGIGYPMTVTGTVIDLFDNGGFNVPASPAALASAGYGSTARFEAVFTSNKKVGSIKPDFWGRWMSSPRYSGLPLWEDMYGYEEIDWDGEAPKLDLPHTTPASTWQALLDQRYGQYGPELAVYDPVWSATGSGVASGSTGGSFDHFSPGCVSNSNAPDRAHRWVAPQSGTYKITTEGSSYDTVLHLYSSQSQIACDDDSGTGYLSSVTLTVTAGQELTIFVDGYGTASGPYTLNIQKL